jgi:hypothetical protein
MSVHQTVQLLASECETKEGWIPEAIPNALKEMPTFAISKDAFLLRLPNGLKFHYQKGNGVTVSRPVDMSDLEVMLFLNGSVYGAIAWINGLVPLHASAIAHEGRVHAFTGHSGAGKSTLAAALGGHALPLFADDVLVLDFTHPSEIICLPGHKRLKLWGDAIDLTGVAAGERVRDGLDKYYINPQAGFLNEPLPLSSLLFLEDKSRSELTIRPVNGIDGFQLSQAAFYRPHFCSAVTNRKDLFQVFSRLSKQVEMMKFDRPRRKDVFDDGVAMIANMIKGR